MKRFLAVALAALLVIGALAGCSDMAGRVAQAALEEAGSAAIDGLSEALEEGTEDAAQESIQSQSPQESAASESESSSGTAEFAPESESSSGTAEFAPEAEASAPDEQGSYTEKDDVALYIATYGKLPQNFITKNEAKKLGWSGGSLEPYAPGKCIGGDHFGNYEGLLPKGEYTECDIDTLGKKSRGAKRIVFSDDGMIYYTSDHYESFTQLYGGESK